MSHRKVAEVCHRKAAEVSHRKAAEVCRRKVAEVFHRKPAEVSWEGDRSVWSLASPRRNVVPFCVLRPPFYADSSPNKISILKVASD